MRGAVCTPSRGLIHSRTAEAVYFNMARVLGPDSIWIPLYTHNDPIPDCFNKLVTRALAIKADWLWFVEEDVAPLPDTLETSLRLADENRWDIVAATYKLRGGCMAHKNGQSGKLLWSGTGCTLVSSRVFLNLGEPYFKVDETWHVSTQRERWEYTGKWDRGYGGHDIDLFARADRAGFKAGLLTSYCPHLTIKKLGTPDTNHGCHEIEEL
jgi:hypothetical protein